MFRVKAPKRRPPSQHFLKENVSIFKILSLQNIFNDSAEYCKILAAPQSLSLNDEPSITAPLFLLLFTSATRSLSRGFTPLNPLNSSPGKVSRFYPFKCHPLLLDHLMLNQPILRPFILMNVYLKEWMFFKKILSFMYDF